MVTRDWGEIRIDGDRLWRRLMAMAQIGSTAKGGVCRVALSDEDKAGRDLFIEWCRAAGCTITIDQMGSIFARRAGTRNDLPPVLVGSHLDSQPTGGKFDGALGVLAGLELIETLNDHHISTASALEIVSWTNEEGARFVPAMIASGVFAGVFDLQFGLTQQDNEGRSLGAELERIGYAGEAPMGGRPIKAAFELHIEQGPILESKGKQIGIVTGVQGTCWYELQIRGAEAHAGPTPMSHRRDPVAGALPILSGIYALAKQHAPDGRATIGDIRTAPGVINTVPGLVTIKIDLRHPDAAVLDAMDEGLRSIIQTESAESGLDAHLEALWRSAPVAFHPECIRSVGRAAELLGTPAMEMVSGAGHDSVYLSRVCPAGMIFIPCEGGLSHNELENILKADAIAGANVLLHAVLDQAA